MSWVDFVALGVAILALLCAAPFFFDRMGWHFPFAPPLPAAPRVPFEPDSEEMKELRQIRIYVEAIGMLAIVQNSDKSSHSLRRVPCSTGHPSQLATPIYCPNNDINSQK
jgi:hypothetical protein